MKSIFRDDSREMRPWLQLVCILITVYVLQFLIMIQGSFILGVIVGFIGEISGNSVSDRAIHLMMESKYFMVGSNILMGIVTVVSIPIIYKSLVKRKAAEIGFISIRKGFKNLLIGLLIGVGLISVLVMTLLLVGEYEFTGINVGYDLLICLVMYIFVGLNEELLVRGAFQHIIYRKHSIIWAILIPSVLFSIMHFLNPNIDVLPGINLFLAGVFFAILTYKTGNIWMSVGVHITWNYTMGTLFGIEVSGMSIGDGLFQLERTTNTVLNGGEFGLEGGCLCTVLLVVSIIIASIINKVDTELSKDKIVLDEEVMLNRQENILAQEEVLIKDESVLTTEPIILSEQQQILNKEENFLNKNTIILNNKEDIFEQDEDIQG